MNFYEMSAKELQNQCDKKDEVKRYPFKRKEGEMMNNLPIDNAPSFEELWKHYSELKAALVTRDGIIRELCDLIEKLQEENMDNPIFGLGAALSDITHCELVTKALQLIEEN